MAIEEIQLYTPRKRSSPKRGGLRRTVSRRKKGAKSLSKLKKELDAVFSKYIRAKYPKYCFTCGKVGTLQNGHFVIRKYLATRWEEDNCRPQCVGCNIYGKGMVLEFEERLIEELGDVRVQELKNMRKLFVKEPTREWYESEIAHYSHLLNGLIDTQ